MSKINVESGGTILSTGLLQLSGGAAMSTTLTAVTDQNNTASPLKLSTTGVQTLSKLQITTADSNYIDAEDNSGNNRFTVGRDPSSQIVNIDFASNPTGLTQMVGGIRTYTDGVNLGTIMSFRKDGQLYVGNNGGSSQGAINFIRNGGGGIGSIGAESSGAGLVLNGGGQYLFMDNSYHNSLGTSQLSLGAMWGIRGSGSTSATTSLLVQNSGGTELFKVSDNGQINLIPLNGGVGSPSNFIANGNDLSFRCGYYFRFLTTGDNKIIFGSSWDGANTYAYNENRQVIGASSINASAQLQVDSTTKGFLPPRMTDAQVRAIASPAVGLMAYNTDLDCPVFYSAAGWRKISHSAM